MPPPRSSHCGGRRLIARNHAKDGCPGLCHLARCGRHTDEVSSSAERTGGVAVTAQLPMGEWVPPHEIAALAVFLATGRARHMTGATLEYQWCGLYPMTLLCRQSPALNGVDHGIQLGHPRGTMAATRSRPSVPRLANVVIGGRTSPTG